MQSTLTTECTHQSIESWRITILGGKVIALKFILEQNRSWYTFCALYWFGGLKEGGLLCLSP